jgi:hypothetical protein
MPESTKESKVSLTLLFCALVTFVMVLAVYAFVFDLNPLNRIGYAMFMSFAPGAAPFLVAKVLRTSSVKWSILIYVVMFVIFQVLMEAIR